MNKRQNRKNQETFTDRLIVFFRKAFKRICKGIIWICKWISHTCYKFLYYSENFIIGGLLRKIVYWHDKKRGQLFSLKEFERLKKDNEVLRGRIKELQGKLLSDYEHLNKRVEDAKADYKTLLEKLNKKVKSLE